MLTLKSLMGYKRTTKLAIMHGSYHYCGAQLSMCWDLQGPTINTNLQFGHLQLDNITRRHLKHTINYVYVYMLIGPSPPSATPLPKQNRLPSPVGLPTPGNTPAQFELI